MTWKIALQHVTLDHPGTVQVGSFKRPHPVPAARRLVGKVGMMLRKRWFYSPANCITEGPPLLPEIRIRSHDQQAREAAPPKPLSTGAQKEAVKYDTM